MNLFDTHKPNKPAPKPRNRNPEFEELLAQADDLLHMLMYGKELYPPKSKHATEHAHPDYDLVLSADAIPIIILETIFVQCIKLQCTIDEKWFQKTMMQWFGKDLNDYIASLSEDELKELVEKYRELPTSAHPIQLGAKGRIIEVAPQ